MNPKAVVGYMVNKFHSIQSFKKANSNKELAMLAMEDLKMYLVDSKYIHHDFKFGQAYNGSVAGKMFGVLLVRQRDGEIGYLAGFSGKLGNKNIYDYFVPPVYDILEENSFFLNKIEIINTINRQIREMKKEELFQSKTRQIQAEIKRQETLIEQAKQELNISRKKRQLQRAKLAEENQLEVDELNKESEYKRMQFKQFSKKQKEIIELLQQELASHLENLEQLIQKRSRLSTELQNEIFKQFQFVNKNKETKSLEELFTQKMGIQPPAGAGECAAPKLLQYAFLNDMIPLALVEFWWGQSPKSEVRKHGEIYPYCKAKCAPILAFMLQEVDVWVVESQVNRYLANTDTTRS